MTSGMRAVYAVLLLLTALFFPGTGPAAYAASNPRYASIVMDADTGVILSESNADKRLYPASLTKVMTLLLTFEALENGALRLQDRVPISKHAASMVPSKLNLPVGSSIRVEDAIYAIVTKSANDISAALAEKIGGTESHFAVLMTRKAREIGMTRTVFRNASGLHNPQQVSTARDMARMAQYILTTYPQYYSYFSTRNFSYRGVSYHNHNRLMSSYKGMDGFKTGYIQPSGFNLIASARRDGRRLIGVVFGGRTANSRNAHMTEILDRGFAKQAPASRTRNMAVALASDSASLSDVPVPDRKPGSTAPIAQTSPAFSRSYSGTAAATPGSLRVATVAVADESVIGEGDYDIEAPARVSPPAPTTIPALSDSDWSIQIGAFGSRARTDGALRQALGKLPGELGRASPVIVPLKTRDGWVFRGRLAGFNKDQALMACRYLPECLPVSPQAY